MAPRRAELRLVVDVAAPAERVWALATDWARQGEWMLGTEVYVVAGDGRGPGSRLVAFTGIGGLGFLDTMEITHWEPPRRCDVRHTGRLVRGTGGFEVRPHGANSTRFTWYERLELPLGPLGALGWPVVAPAYRWGLRRSLRTFAELCRRPAVGGAR